MDIWDVIIIKLKKHMCVDIKKAIQRYRFGTRNLLVNIKKPKIKWKVGNLLWQAGIKFLIFPFTEKLSHLFALPCLPVCKPKAVGQELQ